MLPGPEAGRGGVEAAGRRRKKTKKNQEEEEEEEEEDLQRRIPDRQTTQGGRLSSLHVLARPAKKT